MSKNKAIDNLQHGRHHDPFEYLGRHPVPGGEIIRAFMPSAETVHLEGYGAMERLENSDLFIAELSKAEAAKVPQHYQLRWIEKHDNSEHALVSHTVSAPNLAIWISTCSARDATSMPGTFSVLISPK